MNSDEEIIKLLKDIRALLDGLRWSILIFQVGITLLLLFIRVSIGFWR